MNESPPSAIKAALVEKVAESLLPPTQDALMRRVYGTPAPSGKATAVIGIRRSGKTTYLHQMRKQRLAEGVPARRLPYFNLEDERLFGMKADHLSFLVEEYGRQTADLSETEPTHWYFDEIQVVPGWERFVRRLLDSGRVRVAVTGSSAALLSKEIATALRGRAWEVPIFPFSFEETIRFRKFPVPEGLGSWAGPERLAIERAFLDWLMAGGFPEAQGLPAASRQQLLRDYVDVAILRDVVERYNVTNIAGLRGLVRHLLANAAGLFSVEKFYAALKSQGLAISKDTVHQLLAHLEDCFLVRLVWMEAHSERQRMVNPRKAYPIDPGLIPVYDRSGKANLGHALETAVLIELERRRSSVTYVKTSDGREVDFLSRSPDGRQDLIQVCADASDPATAARELKALAEAALLFPEAGQHLLTLTRDGLPPQTPAGIQARPVYEWMISERVD